MASPLFQHAQNDQLIANPKAFAEDTRLRQKPFVHHAPIVLLWLCIAAYIVFTLRLTFHLFDTFSFQTGWDLAIFDQATWLLSRGQTPFVTARGLHILADHFSVILYFLAPLYWLWEHPKVL